MKRNYKSGSQKRKEQQKKIKCQKEQANSLKAFLAKPDFSDAPKEHKKQKVCIAEDSSDSFQPQLSTCVSPPKEKPYDNKSHSHVLTCAPLSEEKQGNNTSRLYVPLCESVSEKKLSDNTSQLEVSCCKSLSEEKQHDHIFQPPVSTCESLSEKTPDDNTSQPKVSTCASDGALSQNSESLNQIPEYSSNEDFPSDIAAWPSNPTSAMIEFFIRNKPQNTGELKNLKKFFFESKKKYFRNLQEKHFYRMKANGTKEKRNWMIFSETSKSVYCYVCKLSPIISYLSRTL